MENTNIKQENSATEWLENILAEKTKKNPAYSLRAFAQTVNLSPSYLSRILSRKRSLNVKTALKICDRLGHSPEEKQNIISIFNYSEKRKSNPASIKNNDDNIHLSLSLDAFKVISDWYHYGITQLFYTKDFREDHRWIAKMLGISTLDVKLALNRLQRLGILERKNGKLVRKITSLSTTDDISSSGLRRFYKQILTKVITSLEETPLNERDITSITFATNPANLEKAKKEIKKFRKRLSNIMEEGEKSVVYNLNINLIPISKKTSEEK